MSRLKILVLQVYPWDFYFEYPKECGDRHMIPSLGNLFRFKKKTFCEGNILHITSGKKGKMLFAMKVFKGPIPSLKKWS